MTGVNICDLKARKVLKRYFDNVKIAERLTREIKELEEKYKHIEVLRKSNKRLLARGGISVNEKITFEGELGDKGREILRCIYNKQAQLLTIDKHNIKVKHFLESLDDFRTKIVKLRFIDKLPLYNISVILKVSKTCIQNNEKLITRDLYSYLYKTQGKVE